jgi:hypothetical protein
MSIAYQPNQEVIIKSIHPSSQHAHRTDLIGKKATVKLALGAYKGYIVEARKNIYSPTELIHIFHADIKPLTEEKLSHEFLLIMWKEDKSLSAYQRKRTVVRVPYHKYPSDEEVRQELKKAGCNRMRVHKVFELEEVEIY